MKTKKWCIILLSFAGGIAIGIVSVYSFFLQIAERVATRNECQTEQQEAQTVLLCLKAVDGGTTNDFRKFHAYAHSVLAGYVHDRDELKKNYIQLPYLDDEKTYKQAQEYLAKPIGKDFENTP